jgi:hypothetical protein
VAKKTAMPTYAHIKKRIYKQLNKTNLILPIFSNTLDVTNDSWYLDQQIHPASQTPVVQLTRHLGRWDIENIRKPKVFDRNIHEDLGLSNAIVP